MRLWSIHPKYLDTKGLVALWRESLLAKKVLENETKGYKKHPQLERFKKHKDPLVAINTYIYYVFLESKKRKFSFNEDKFLFTQKIKINITEKQLEYEFKHLLKKLKTRDPGRYTKLFNNKNILPHPIFQTIPGEIENWENIKN